MVSNKSLNIFHIIFLYTKKLLNFKNILFFVISFLAFLSVWFIILDIISSFNNDAFHIDAWLIMFFSIWICTIVNYSYIFLKKNNFEMIEEWKNSISNFIISFMVFIFLFLGLYLFMFNDKSSIVEMEKFDSFIKIFFNYFTLAFTELLLVSFIYNKRLPNMGYILILSITIINFMYFLFMFYSDNRIFEGDTFIFSHTLFLIYINLILLAILSITNFAKRLFIHKFIE